MLEIDGEFFEDPCEIISAGRTIIAATLLATAFSEYGIILSEPLFPPKSAIKGDIVHVK